MLKNVKWCTGGEYHIENGCELVLLGMKKAERDLGLSPKTFKPTWNEPGRHTKEGGLIEENFIWGHNKSLGLNNLRIKALKGRSSRGSD